MKSLTKTSLAFIVVAAALGLSTPLHATDTEQDRKDVQRVLERYLESVKSADLSLASTIWLQTPDIVAVTLPKKPQSGIREGSAHVGRHVVFDQQ